MLTISNFWAKYAHSNWILRGLNLRLHSGEFVVIGGKSGSGKTTLARCLVGLFPSFYDGEVKGEIDVLGKNPLVGPRKMFGTVGFVSQRPSDYTVALTVKEEMLFPLENLGLSKVECFSRIRHFLNLLSIEDLIDQPTTELSAGELQKVEIASALSLRSKILVLDEPLARLDRSSAIDLVKKLKHLVEDGVLVIIFEHHLDEVLPVADKVFMLDNGQLIKLAAPDDFMLLFEQVDLPEISETFLNLQKKNLVDEIPITINRAHEIVEEKIG